MFNNVHVIIAPSELSYAVVSRGILQGRVGCICFENCLLPLLVNNPNLRFQESCRNIKCGGCCVLDKFDNCDKNYEEIANAIFANDGYVAEHPLTKNE